MSLFATGGAGETEVSCPTALDVITPNGYDVCFIGYVRLS